MRSPTPSQKAFIQAIAQGATLTAAYRKAFKVGAAGDGSVSSRACQMAKKPQMVPLVEAARLQFAQRIQQASDTTAVETARRHADLLRALGLSRERLIRELVRVAFADMRQVARWDEEGKVVFKNSAALGEEDAALVSEIIAGPRNMRLKLHDKLSALTTLAKIMGLFAPAPDGDKEPTLHLSINIVPPEGDGAAGGIEPAAAEAAGG